MTKYLIVFILALMSVFAQGQAYVAGGGEITTGLGYHSFAPVGVAGYRLDKKVFAFGELGADGGKKIDTGDGYSLRLRSGAYFHVNKTLALGGGVTYTKLYTSQYEKSALRPRAGAVIETTNSESVLDYVFKNDVQNGLQGVEYVLTVPRKGRFFYRQDVGVYFFHGTFLPAEHHTGFASRFMIGVRF